MAAYTPTELGNIALAHLGDKRISDIAEKSVAATACRDFYGHATRMAFEAHEWTCFKRTAELNPVTPSTPLLRWLYAYSFPPNFVRFGALGENWELAPQYQDWSQNADFIAANAPALFAEYVASDFSEAQYPAYFANVVGHLLAIQICAKIQGTLAGRAALEDTYERRTLPAARSKDSLNHPTRTATRSFFKEARFGRRTYR